MSVIKMTDLDLAGKRVFIRADLNVPVKDGKVTSDARIRASLPTIELALKQGAKVMVTSHLGRPTEGEYNEEFSLLPVVNYLKDKLSNPVRLVKDYLDGVDVAEGELVVLENVRFNKGEKKDDETLSKKYAALCDVFVMDAFGTAHRKHASTAVIADYFDADNKMLGYLMEKEVQAVDNILKDIKRPFTAIMGGSKVSTKIGIIENLMDKVDNLILCGGMTYTFAKAQGGKIGNSIVEDDKLELALDIIAKAKAKGVNLVLGTDCVAADAFSNDANTQVVPANNIPDGWEGLDAGPETQKAFAAAIEDAKTILWNGPTGVFEFENFTHGSRTVGEAIVEATKNGAFSLVGGGDSVACVNKFGLASGVSYVSTGGGALLEAIEGKVLPGIAAIQE